MMFTPLDKIGLHWRDHKSALWWLGLLYRRPFQFNEATKGLPFLSALQFYLHISPYILLVCIVTRLIIFDLLKLPTSEILLSWIEIIWFHLSKITIGVIIGFAILIIAIIENRISMGITIAIITGVVVGSFYGMNDFIKIASEIVFVGVILCYFGTLVSIFIGRMLEYVLTLVAAPVFGFIFMFVSEDWVDKVKSIFAYTGVLPSASIAGIILGKMISGGLFGDNSGTLMPEILAGIYGTSSGFFICKHFEIKKVLAKGIVIGVIGGTVIGIVRGFFTGIIAGSIICIVFSVFLLRAYYYPLFWWLSWPRPLGQLYHYHPLTWDDLCKVRFPGFDQLLVAYTEFAPERGMKEIERLNVQYPNQSRTVRRAETILILRHAAKQENLAKLKEISAQLPEDGDDFYAFTPKLRAMVTEISNLQHQLDTVKYPILREPLSQALCNKIKNDLSQIIDFGRPFASELHKAATNWLTLAEKQFSNAQQYRSKLAEQFSEIKNLQLLEDLIKELPDESYTQDFVDFAKLRSMLEEITSIQTLLDAVTRLVLREPYAQIVCEKMENLQHKVARLREPLASGFRAAASNWLELAHTQWQQAQAITSKEPNPQIFRAGDPVNREQEAFVPRYGVVGDLEKQIMLATGCPGLVLYGRRRMGKSTILNNLNGFLPDTVVPVFVSMQDPQAFTSLAEWMSHLLKNVSAALSRSSSPVSTVVDLPGFMRVLSEYNANLQETSKRVLLAIDEYENLDRKIGEKVFPEDLLATIRESIQTHRNITWIFSGSHEITELKHAEWPSYLVSVRTIEVPMFTMAETRLLLTEPLKFSPLFKDESKRPRFDPGFWGESGIERIQHDSGGWPHLVQLIAETVVDLINDETKTQVDAELFERSLNKAIVSGHNVLYQLVRGESTLPGEWDYLSAFRKRELQPPPEDEKIYASLRRRLLVAEEAGEWRLRVPLMARWLRERG